MFNWGGVGSTAPPPPPNWGSGVWEKGSIDRAIVHSYHELWRRKNGQKCFLTKCTAKDHFSEADSKNSIFIFCRILGLGHLRGPGVGLRRILGGPSIEPLGGLARRLYQAPPLNAPRGRKNGEGGEETGQGERDEQREVSGEGRPRSPKTVQSAEGGEGKETRERIIVAVRSPCQENYPADAHPSAQVSAGFGKPSMDSECASGCTWSMARATARLRDSRPPE